MITTEPPYLSAVRAQRPPARRLSTWLLVGLSLSVGWGIRGNFGHEYGAAFAGCLAALTVSLLSGRDDWRERVLYFGFYGAIGWGFGGSMSYMQMISATESGQAASQWYGYVALYYIGFLWAALGAAGTAFAAVAERPALVKLFKPILFVFGAWLLLDLIEDPVAQALQDGASFDHTWARHKSPLYWFDADYLAAFFALLGVGVYDLTESRGLYRWILPIYAGAGALGGWLIQWLLRLTGLENRLAALLTYPLGDPAYLDPATGQRAFGPDDFLNNWPQWFGDYPGHVGWVVGLVLGLTAWFVQFGRFRNGSSLIVYMASGWLLSFLAFPVLGSLFFREAGGLRMTPPRADDWAGITGVFLGMMLWMRRNRYLPVALASVMAGTIGGLGFSGVQWLKQLLMAPGNPRIPAAQGFGPGDEVYDRTLIDWAAWQGQNWHSFLEQTYGFVNGLSVAVAMAMLASRLPIQRDAGPRKGRWTLGFAAFFLLLAIPYVNLVKNVKEWGDHLNPDVWKRVAEQADGSTQSLPALWDIPYLGHLPGGHWLSLTPEGWFNLTWLLITAVFVVVIRRHLREPLALIPETWLGKGQLVFLILLWLMVIGNFERALVGWTPTRLLTEWGIFLNASVATVLVLLAPRRKENSVVMRSTEPLEPLYGRACRRAMAAGILSGVLFLVTNRMIYRYPADSRTDRAKYFTRFGPEANWRARPNLKNATHK
ncbi:hypothetical protein [Larkinella soli]|uniref:hypothetical protein n=1 Tax=Larkinella soli TaxID=1770527 RepID=UPI000FFC3AB1|nr:hypothetical protein [Larkinella soli]